MKKFIFTILAVGLVLGGCSLSDDGGRKSDVGDDTRLQGDVGFLDLKMKCANYKNDIQRDIDELNKTRDVREIFEQIFYSPKLNTCLYVSSLSVLIDGDYELMSYDIYDVLTRENLYNFNLLDYDENYMNDSVTYLRVVNKVRNEVLEEKIEELKSD